MNTFVKHAIGVFLSVAVGSGAMGVYKHIRTVPLPPPPLVEPQAPGAAVHLPPAQPPTQRPRPKPKHPKKPPSRPGQQCWWIIPGVWWDCRN